MTRTMAVDPGTVRVGIALSDPLGIVAQPHSTVLAEPRETLPERLAELARSLDAQELVVGLPYRMDGSQGPEAKAARALAQELRRAAGLRVTLVDERLTSVAAERALLAGGAKRRSRRQLSDQVAAALILQTHLERTGGGRS